MSGRRKPISSLVVVAVLVVQVLGDAIHDLQVENRNLRNSLASMDTTVKSLTKNLEDLTRQVMLQQTFVEERIRSDGSSGLKQVRNGPDGPKPYYTRSTAAAGVAGIHEHANNIRTVGMGELNVVLNGVDFRTRHNDYRLRMPANNSVYNDVVDIPYPDVPPEVLHKHTVHDQVLEMREWFKAFKNQDHSVRDYRKYFKPVLVYMEGGWTTNTKTLEEPFFSDRHHIDASSWFDLQDKVRFTSYSGGKNNLENFAYLPTTIMNVNNGTPEYAQWNYRIVAHPLKDALGFNEFVLVDDLTERMKSKITMDTLNSTRQARFYVRQKRVSDSSHRRLHNSQYVWGLMDDLMYEVPGKDNYPGNLNDNSMGLTAYHVKSTPSNMMKLNTARYHRWYRVDDKDAMGQTRIHRGFSDQNLYVAQTTNPKIAPLTVKTCVTMKHSHRRQNCTTYTERYTWAFPLEVVYMTPLLTWNPYKLHHVPSSSPKDIYHVVHDAHGKLLNGELTPDKAYNGTHNKLFYRTPVEFFSSKGAVGVDKADTAKGSIGVLDPHGVVREVVASGNRIILPSIEGVGKVRTRWPIMPLHAEGEQTRKELEALKDMVMRMPTYGALFEEMPTSTSKANALFMEKEHSLKVPQTTRDPPGLHDHHVTIHQYDIEDMKKGHTVHGVLTSISNGHQHSLDIKMVGDKYVIVKCDGQNHCWDGHDFNLIFEY